MLNIFVLATMLSAGLQVIAGDITAAPPQPASVPSLHSSLEKRQRAMDTCAYLDVNDSDLGQLQSCFCLSGVNAYINAMYASETPARRRFLRQKLRGLVTDNGEVCTYPPNSRPNCQQGAPCLFSCTRGYTANQMTRTCDCTARGRIDCGGRCVRGTACVSGVPVTRRELALQEANPCDVGETLCGVRSARAGQDSWECVKTNESLESCGGCTVPYDNAAAFGRDCSTIDADAVSCIQGSCRVTACKSGFRSANNGTDCTPMAKIAARSLF
ncbi:hypothetical protein HGRIS_007106 [Hohenbuehelia grisea]|uniref:Protein CPL1-like domain-containing protein n=1 Tax=Hohenbuehelia grisea TaxID=104357 RepID=A0ABR3JBD0_9AGAR